ncbi:MAG TPA: helix-turn-helix domain-containing protein [Vicinamibacterales bacterium]|jgi:predicted ATPase/DNA-binding XRE family transcriptional regulator
MGIEVRPFGAQLKALRDAAGFTQEELAAIAGLSVHAISALERGERKRPQGDTVRALSAALDLPPTARDAFVASARGYASTPSADARARASLPFPPTPLIGRERALGLLRLWTADPTARLVTLIGPGGVGKTRLVVSLAHTLAADPSVQLLYVPLAALHDASFVASAVTEAFGLDDATARDLPRRVRAACRDDPTWLVLDNFEHVSAAAPLVADLLAHVPSLRVLVTSRAPLHLRGEREFAVEPLELEGLPDRHQAPVDLEAIASMQLFVSRARDVRPDFRLTPSNGPIVAAICRRLDGLPLALELVAPWVKALTPEGLLAHLEGPGLLTTEGPGDLPERQRTMNATVAWSVQLLETHEQRAFRRLGAIPGSFSVSTANAVLASEDVGQDEESHALGLLLTLLDKSLLFRVETSSTAEPLYSMLETVRTYAAHELAASGEYASAMDGLVRYCLWEGALAATGIPGSRQIAWLDRVRDDLESHRCVLAWLLSHDRAEDATELAWSLLLFWIMRGHSAEGLQWFEQAQRAVKPGSLADTRSLAGASLLRFTQGDLDGARKASGPVVRDAHADSEALAHALLSLGHVDYASGRVENARDHFIRVMVLGHNLGVSWLEASGVTGLAWTSLGANDPTQAARLLDEADALWTDSGPWFRALGLYLRAVLALQARDAQEVLRLTRESLSGIQAFQETFALAYALVPLLAAAELLDDDIWVARVAGTSDAFTDRTGARAVDPVTDTLCAHAQQHAEARLGPERWAAAHAAGRRLSVTEILREIDAAMDHAG